MKKLQTLQDELQKQKEFKAILEKLKPIDSLEFDDYGLRDARKIQKLLWLEEGKNWNWKKVVSLKNKDISLRRGKEYDFSENSIFTLYVSLEKWERLSFKLWKRFRDIETIKSNIEGVEITIQQYEDAIKEYDTFVQKKEEREMYRDSVSYLLRYE